jgi:organic radical activating enzyme
MKELVEVKSKWPDDELRIEYMIGNTCNFKCWYCFPGSHEGTHRWGDIDLVTDNFTYLINHYKKNGKKKIWLHIIGGEPTLWPELGSFAKTMTELGCSISISTNGSRTLRWWKEHAKYFRRVTLSCHHEEMDLQHNIDVGDILYKSGCIVDAMVLMDPNCWDKCTSIVEGLRSSKYRWSIIATEIVAPGLQYTEQQTKYISKPIKRLPNIFWFFKNNEFHIDNLKVVFDDSSTKKVNSNWIRLNKLNYFKGWDCNLGKDSIFITKEGFVTGTCQQLLYGKSWHYSLYAPNFKDQFDPIITSVLCSRDVCTCQPEINLRKKKVIPLIPVSSIE